MAQRKSGLRYSELSEIFTNKSLTQIFAAENFSHLKDRLYYAGVLDNWRDETIGKCLELAYQQLIKNYRTEYVYKNVLFQEAVREYLENSTVSYSVLSEFRLNQSKIDLLVLNGTSIGYEIKSERDSVKRLESQLNDYFLCLEYVYLVTYPEFADKHASMVPNETGIIIVNEDSSLLTIRDAKSNLDNINLAVMFDSLRKPEYSQILRMHFGSLPTVPNTAFRPACKDMFISLNKSQAHQYFIETLKSRKNYSQLEMSQTILSPLQYWHFNCLENFSNDAILDITSRFLTSV